MGLGIRRGAAISAVVLSLAVIPLVAPNAARAEYGDVCVEGLPTCIANPTKWTFYGTVTDAIGRPVPGVRVQDPYEYGGRVANTDAGGAYRLDFDGPVCCTQGSSELQFSKADMVTATAYGGTLTGEDDRVDAELLYRAQTSVSPYAVRPGERVTVSVQAKIPEPQDACGYTLYYDRDWHWVIEPMVLAGTNSLGSTTWRLELPADLTAPSTSVSAWVEDCESREVLTNYAYSSYYRSAA